MISRDVKLKILNNNYLLGVVVFFQNIIYWFWNSKKIKGKENAIKIGENVILRKASFKIIGNNNTIIISKNCRMRNMKFEIEGSNNMIFLDEKVNFMEKGWFLIQGENSRISIGKSSLFRDAKLFAGESNTKIEIGNSCFCGIVSFSTSDFHSIIDLESGRRINPPGDIKVGDNNWITNHILIRKGAEINDNSVISPYSIVNRKFEKSNIVLAGQPAKIIKENITWSREKLPY